MNTANRLLIQMVLAIVIFASTQSATAFYDTRAGRWLSRDPIAEWGGLNPYGFVMNDSVNYSDVLGLYPAQVQSITYTGHGTVDWNGGFPTIVDIDVLISGEGPLDVSRSHATASIAAKVDESVSASISTRTDLQAGPASLTSLQVSTFLQNGKIKACCTCAAPGTRIRAQAQVESVLNGTAGSAHADFEHLRSLATAARPRAGTSGAVEKSIDSSYCATFEFKLGQGWTDKSRTRRTVSSVTVNATFDCIQ